MSFDRLVLVLLLVGILLIGSGFWLYRKRSEENNNIISLMYSLTHDELSNPIQSALAALVNLEKRLGSDRSSDHDDLRALRTALNRLSDVTRNLRSLILLDMSNTARVSERVNIVALIQSLIVELGEQADQKGVRLIYEGRDAETLIMGQAEDLRRVFSNVIDNGIRYSCMNPQACVLVSLSIIKKKVTVAVSDNGSGMSSQRLASLGSMPQRPSARTIGTSGAGLGLFLVRQIVDRHNGGFHVESTESRGTTVTITFKQVTADQ